LEDSLLLDAPTTLRRGSARAGFRTQASPEPLLDEVELTLLDHESLDWGRIHRAVYLLHQHLHYEYPAPISNLRHRLMIVPPESYGDQRRIRSRLDVSDTAALVSSHRDCFGNHVVEVRTRKVPQAIDFASWVLVERTGGAQRRTLSGRVLAERFLEPTALTEPDAALVRAARALAAGSVTRADLAHRINEWVYDTLEYAPGVTDVQTSAAAALSLGRGVCQDYAHVMLALCRLCGLPARYVSGHLLGEGGTHAWVEVIIPSPGRPQEALVLALDPTHGRETNLSYLTVAVGRDYGDVTPTSGTFRGPAPGRLLVRKRLGLAIAELADFASGGGNGATISA